MEINDTRLTLVHATEYRDWRFSASSPTQGVRFERAAEQMSRRYPQYQMTVMRPDESITLKLLERVHDPKYVSHVLDDLESDEWAGKNATLAGLAGLFVQGTLTAFYELMSGNAHVAVHWPGAKHHAQYDYSSGFCVFADFALAADLATEMGLKVAILDFDAHHGNSTEDLLLDHESVMTLSMHEWGIFPGTGAVSRPDKHAYNWPLASRTDSATALRVWHEMLATAKSFSPDIVFVAAGADAHETDPLSTLQFTVGVYREFGTSLRNVFPSTPLLVGGAGGYQPHDYTPLVWNEFIAGVMTA